MISPKTIIGVIVVAIIIGILYVSLEKKFRSNPIGNPEASSSQELTKEETPKQNSLISLPSPEPTLAPINESSNLLDETTKLEMRDYSSYFVQLKDNVNKPI